ncbi:hypothetical protein [Mangrovibacterium sp.]|uniref:hypothetical protein n=1 Tax=Mangrovibacterium sp. TaxID=1961364 RepID=UPI0035654335
MKNRFFQIVGIVVLLSLSLSLSAASGNRTDGDYRITPVPQTELASGIDKAWTLVYSTSESPISIEFQCSKRCTTYCVRGENFEVVYECSRKGFGARKAKASESTIPQELNMIVVNKEEIGRQQILTSEKVDDERALTLIAAYLPDLLNTRYNTL